MDEEEDRPNFNSLNVPGVNGILSLVAFLLWWGKKANTGGEATIAIWAKSVQEVCGAIEAMNNMAEVNDSNAALAVKRK
jgi:hypothetical protein